MLHFFFDSQDLCATSSLVLRCTGSRTPQIDFLVWWSAWNDVTLVYSHRCGNSFTGPNHMTDLEPSPCEIVLSHRLTTEKALKSASLGCGEHSGWSPTLLGPLCIWTKGAKLSGATLVKYETCGNNHHNNPWFSVNVWLAGVVANIDNEPMISTRYTTN